MTTPELPRRTDRRSAPRRVTPFSVPLPAEDDGLEFPLKQAELEQKIEELLGI